ncbi:MAG: peptidylprolyl isomerase [Elainellaceae cyanobacterium]
MNRRKLLGTVFPRKTIFQFLTLVAIAALVLSGCTPSGGADVVSSGPNATTIPTLDGSAVVEMVINGEPVNVEINGEYAPITAGNFVDLVEKGFYDGVSFHRVVRQPEPFVVQAGDPQSKDPDFPAERLGTGGYVDPGTGSPRYIPLEIAPEGADGPIYSQPFSTAGITESPQLPHTRGAIAMARSNAPDSASSQFYIALSDLSFLDGEYAVFGYVEDGDMAVVDGIEQGDRVESARVVSGLDNLRRGEDG